MFIPDFNVYCAHMPIKTYIEAEINNHIIILLYDVIRHQCHNFDGSLANRHWR